ncbi:MAG: 3-deoxy-D-manno-octulosonic acid transferase [Tannerella sp.]|jgi:3-deoxy-D-manno-octulosonic-acid transferase|nr:3-deoxy-D-manno-octulosonic acid transferase [Tannerella sp.]
MRLIYTLALHTYALFTALFSFFNRKARMIRLGQWRTNNILRTKIDPHASYIWFHAASLGEFEQGRPLMEAIRRQHPRYKILLTFFSPSGYEVRKNYDGADVICYLPFDTPFRVKKFLNLARPCMAIFIKYEFWMNYLRELKRRRIPTFVISAIFRREQLFFRHYGRWYRRTLECFDRLFVQDRQSAQLLAEYGIAKVSICGDTRFDRVLDIRRQARIFPLLDLFAGNGHCPVLVAGSTWPQDENLIIPYFNSHPGMKLIIAPHEIHREHLLDIESKLQRPSLRISETNQQSVADKDCLIIDSFGLLSSIYRYGRMAYIGGGFGRGIHNTLEAAVYGIPVIFGPGYHKFKEARDLIALGGAFSPGNETAFVRLMDDLTARPELRENTGAIVGEYVKQHTGATERIMAELPFQ